MSSEISDAKRVICNEVFSASHTDRKLRGKPYGTCTSPPARIRVGLSHSIVTACVYVLLPALRTPYPADSGRVKLRWENKILCFRERRRASSERFRLVFASGSQPLKRYEDNISFNSAMTFARSSVDF
jgi:hypothetical protein